MNEPGNPETTTHPEVQISATNFGPIVSGTVDLRPLTVFVGPSNTGKTYFATLIYASHRLSGLGFGGFPACTAVSSRFWRKSPIMTNRRRRLTYGERRSPGLLSKSWKPKGDRSGSPTCPRVYAT